MSASWNTNEVRARLAHTTSATALAFAVFAALPGAAFAQDAAAEEAADEGEAIVVTGFARRWKVRLLKRKTQNKLLSQYPRKTSVNCPTHLSLNPLRVFQGSLRSG